MSGWFKLATHLFMGRADKLLLLVVPTLSFWLVIIFSRKRLYRQFPFFFAYLISVITIGALRFSVIDRYRTYFKVYWATEAVYAVLALLALHEVFRRVFFGFYIQLRWFRLLFPIIAGLTVLVTVWAAVHDPPVQASPLISVILLFGMGVNCMQALLFCLFVVLADSFKVRWRYSPLGIVVGFATSALGALLAYWVRSEFGTKFETFAKYVPPAASIIALAVWLDTFLRPEPVPEWVSQMTPQQWAEALRRDAIVLKKFMDRFK